MKWNQSGFRPLLCTYGLNWARRTSWGWWDEWHIRRIICSNPANTRYWPNVVLMLGDAGPTLKQHWINDSWLLRMTRWKWLYVYMQTILWCLLCMEKWLLFWSLLFTDLCHHTYLTVYSSAIIPPCRLHLIGHLNYLPSYPHLTVTRAESPVLNPPPPPTPHPGGWSQPDSLKWI